MPSQDRRTLFVFLHIALCCLLGNALAAEPAKNTVPFIYTTDLYHPHDDPDDHFDLATLFAIPEFDLRAIVIDRGPRGAERPATLAIEQMIAITGRDVPFANGLTQNLLSPTDRAVPTDRTDSQTPDDQDGVALILDTLRFSERPVTIFTTGSLRDVAAAYNREPDLFHSKLARLYINAGHCAGGREWNVDLDRHAFFRILAAPLPIYWMPCFGEDGYGTFWRFEHREVLDSAPLAIQNFILYALQKESPQALDPITALKRIVPPGVKKTVWPQKRNMWCTGGFLHAANRPNETFTFEKMPVWLDVAAGRTPFATETVSVSLYTFHHGDQNTYTHSMTESLRTLLRTLGK